MSKLAKTLPSPSGSGGGAAYGSCVVFGRREVGSGVGDERNVSVGVGVDDETGRAVTAEKETHSARMMPENRIAPAIKRKKVGSDFFSRWVGVR